MKLLIGLGNPGKEYDVTRHNLGYAVLDQVAVDLEAPSFRPTKKFSADISEVAYRGDKLILAKPTTYMNLSGKAVQSLVQFYKISPKDVWVIHDELDLPFGILRIKQGGSDAGHNGLKSISAAIGADYWRFRLGIANSKLRTSVGAVEFVLHKFEPQEMEKLESATGKATAQILLCLNTPANLHLPEVMLT